MAPQKTPIDARVVRILQSTGLKQGAIAKELGCSQGRVSQLLKQPEIKGTEWGASRSGRPSTISAAHRRALCRTAQKERRAPLQELATGHNVSVSSARRILKESGIQKRRPAKKPFLHQEHRKARLQWCREHRAWTVEQWERVIWSDEASVRVGENPAPEWVFRRAGERFKEDCLIPSFKSDRRSIMVWAGFHGMEKSKLYCFEKGSIDSAVYQSVLREGLFGLIEADSGLLESQLGGCDLIFQQDNAPIHTSRQTMHFLNSHGVRTMKWPANSPDLNPIENIWTQLKAEFHRRWLAKRACTKGRLSVEQLKALLEDSWESIGADRLRSVVHSMPRRVAEVIKARGGACRY